MSVSFRKLIGGGYDGAWYSSIQGNCRYRVFIGARNTKKSVDIGGFEPIDKILSNENRNVLFVRMNDSDNSASTYNNEIWCLSQMGIPDITKYFWIRTQPNLIQYLPTGQVIMFRGMNNPTGLASIKVQHGYLTDIYIEEASEIESEDDFRRLDGSIRGELPDGLQLQITFLLNPWDIKSWIYEKFCKGRLSEDMDYLEKNDRQEAYYPNFIWFGKGLYIHRSTYRINEFRTKEYDEVAMEMRRKAPDIYKTEFLGLWGNTEGQTYPEFSDSLITKDIDLSLMRYSCYAIGIDTGLSNGEGTIRKDGKVKSATTAQLVALTEGYTKMAFLGEYFWTNEGKMGSAVKNEMQLVGDIVKSIAQWKKKFEGDPTIMKGIIPVFVDSADIGFRQNLELELRRAGIGNVQVMASTKIKIVNRVRFSRLLMAYREFLISPSCQNLIREIKNSQKGDKGEARDGLDDHAINASEYAWVSFYRKMVRWRQFKEI